MSNLDALLKAIDAGERDALFPLADLLMEMDDPRGRGVAWLAQDKNWPTTTEYADFCFYDWWPHDGTLPNEASLPWGVIHHLEKTSARYRSLSAAILDAARAMVKSDAQTKR